MKKLSSSISVLVGIAFLAMGCSKDATTMDEVNDSGPLATVPFQELYDQGVDRYLGAFEPTSTMSPSTGVTEYFFDIPDGPICYTGSEFSMFTRDGNSNQLLIFLQGGGFCGSFSCVAVEEGLPLVPFWNNESG